MTLKKAIEVLNIFQRWRLGDEDIDMQKPSVVTEAINTLLDFTDSPEFFAKMSEKPTNHIEISDEEIEKEGWKYCYENKISSTNIVHWITACKWYRYQLNKNK